MPDLEYLYKDHVQLLKAYAAGQNKVINEPTAQEVTDFEKLKTALGYGAYYNSNDENFAILYVVSRSGPQ